MNGVPNNGITVFPHPMMGDAQVYRYLTCYVPLVRNLYGFGAGNMTPTFSGGAVTGAGAVLYLPNPATGLLSARTSGVAQFTPDGLWCGGAGGNSLLYSRLFDNAAWTSNLSALTANAVGVDGVANSAYTATDSDATYRYVRQGMDVPKGSETYTVSVFVLKDADTTRFPEANYSLGTAVSGGAQADIAAAGYHLNTSTGAVIKRYISGTVTSYVTSAGLWWRWEVRLTNNNTATTYLIAAVAPAGGAVFGTFSAAATGSIVMDAMQVEARAFVGTGPGVIVTTGAAGAVTAVALTYPVAGNISPTTGTAASTITANGVLGETRDAVDVGGTGAGRVPYVSGTALAAYDGTTPTTIESGFTTGAVESVVVTWGSGGMQALTGKGTYKSFAWDGSLGTGANLAIGQISAGAEPLCGPLGRLVILGIAATLPDMRRVCGRP